jgi:hypothetical protein
LGELKFNPDDRAIDIDNSLLDAGEIVIIPPVS